MLTVDPHSLLDLAAFRIELPGPLRGHASPDWLVAALAPGHASPLPPPPEDARTRVRDMLRVGGFKPAGRSKPASEYLVKAAESGRLGTINLVVDACNVASLHGAVPISVVDLDRVESPLRVGIAEPGSSYVFNASGQEIDLGGLLCLFDAHGPCANAVKDSQRTKTHDDTTRALALVWGTTALEGRADAVAGWMRELLQRAGCITDPVR